MRRLRADMVWGLVLAGAAALLLTVVYWPALSGAGAVPPGFGWPRAVLWSLFVLSLLLVLRGWQQGETRHAEESERQPLRMPLLVALIGAAYFVSLSYVGFVAATFIFAATLPVVLGRPWREALVYALGFTAISWATLIRLLHVPPPKGVGVFYSVSAWLS